MSLACLFYVESDYFPIWHEQQEKLTVYYSIVCIWCLALRSSLELARRSQKMTTEMKYTRHAMQIKGNDEILMEREKLKIQTKHQTNAYINNNASERLTLLRKIKHPKIMKIRMIWLWKATRKWKTQTHMLVSLFCSLCSILFIALHFFSVFGAMHMCVRRMHRVYQDHMRAFPRNVWRTKYCSSTQYTHSPSSCYTAKTMLTIVRSLFLSIFFSLTRCCCSLIFVFCVLFFLSDSVWFGLVFPRFVYDFACVCSGTLWVLLFRSFGDRISSSHCIVVAIRCSHCRFNLLLFSLLSTGFNYLEHHFMLSASIQTMTEPVKRIATESHCNGCLVVFDFYRVEFHLVWDLLFDFWCARGHLFISIFVFFSQQSQFIKINWCVCVCLCGQFPVWIDKCIN